MNGVKLGGLIVVGAVLVILGLSVFTVGERELAIKLQLGRVVETGYDPGQVPTPYSHDQ
jgi:regulator of protease activity HflC (stomatin/prohibitin superfamily)